MEMRSIRNFFDDKIRLSYLGALLVLGVFAYSLLVEYDLGNIARYKREFRSTGGNLLTLQRTGDYTSYLEQFNSNFAVDKGANWLIDVIAKLAEGESVSLESLRPAETRLSFGYKVVRVAAEGSSAYADMTRFVKSVERYENKLFIEEFSCTATDIVRQALSRPSGRPGGDIGPRTAPEAPTPVSDKVIRFRIVVAFISV